MTATLLPTSPKEFARKHLSKPTSRVAAPHCNKLCASAQGMKYPLNTLPFSHSYLDSVSIFSSVEGPFAAASGLLRGGPGLASMSPQSSSSSGMRRRKRRMERRSRSADADPNAGPGMTQRTFGETWKTHLFVKRPTSPHSMAVLKSQGEFLCGHLSSWHETEVESCISFRSTPPPPARHCGSRKESGKCSCLVNTEDGRKTRHRKYKMGGRAGE